LKSKKVARVRIEDVAAQAGVAISSVSRVLSGHKSVSEAMKIKVEKSVNNLGYRPDHLAQSLRRGTTHTIGFMIRDIMNPFFSTIAQSCEAELRKSHYSMILINSSGTEDTEKLNFAILKSRRVDGVIASLVSETSESVKEDIELFGAPTVLLDRKLPGVTSSAVLSDHALGVKKAVAHLLSQGHTRIAFISGPKDMYVTKNRLEGFRSAYKDADEKIFPELIRLKDFTEKYAKEETLKLFKLPKPPTAILTGGIGASGGTLHALKEIGKVPEKDVTIIALDEWPLFDLLNPPISSVYRNPELIGKYAAELILELIRGEAPRTILIPTTFHSVSEKKAKANSNKGKKSQ
jgi:LacI family transcriptional regulator